MKKLIIFSLLITLLLTGCNFEAMRNPVDENDTTVVKVTVPRGATTTSIGALLIEEGLIQSEMAFKMAAKELGADGKMQAGDYEVSKSMSTDAIIEKMVSGDVVIDTFTFTIPEGFEVKDIKERLVAEGYVDADKFDLALEKKYDYKFLEGQVYFEGQTPLEGFLFPDTYVMRTGATEEEIINRMLQRFDEVFTDEYYTQAEALGYTVNEVVTLASIVEREAAAKEEFPTVAGVFHNRLNHNKMLQSCATVQYVLGERKPRLSLEDVAVESPYNTYINTGLPPAPIASPGKLALESTLNPESHTYFFFVVKKGGNGTHVFSETLSEHNKAKEENR